MVAKMLLIENGFGKQVSCNIPASSITNLNSLLICSTLNISRLSFSDHQPMFLSFVEVFFTVYIFLFKFFAAFV